MRVVRGEASYFGHVDGLGESELLEVADSVAQARARRRRASRSALAAARPAEGHPSSAGPRTCRPRDKAALLRSCDERARGAGDEITQVTVGYVEGRRIVEIFNSDGLAAADDRTRTRLSTQVVARRGERVETGTDTRGGHAGYEILADDPEAVAESAARKALTAARRGGRPHGPPARWWSGNGFGGVLLHEAVGHGLEADAVQKRASVYAGPAGRPAGRARRGGLRRRRRCRTSGAATASTTRARPPAAPR